MGYVPGNTLRFTMSEEGFTDEPALLHDWLTSYFLPVLDGAAAIHQSGIVHRDMKPENVLMDAVAGFFNPLLDQRTKSVCLMTELDDIRYFAVSDIGLRRKRNEDAYAIYDAAATMTVRNGRVLLFAVADGLGGHSCGDLASQIACREMKTFLDGSHSAGMKG